MQADAVLGPSFDGGYYLIGMKKPLKPLFTDIPFGTGDTLQKTLMAARRGEHPRVAARVEARREYG